MKIKSVGRLLLLLGPVGIFPLGLLAGLVSVYFLIPLLAYFFIGATLAGRLRCPTCGRPVYLEQLKNALGPADHYWSPFMAKRCVHCRTDLTQAKFEWKMFSRQWKPSDQEHAWTRESGFKRWFT